MSPTIHCTVQYPIRTRSGWMGFGGDKQMGSPSKPFKTLKTGSLPSPNPKTQSLPDIQAPENLFTLRVIYLQNHRTARTKHICMNAGQIVMKSDLFARNSTWCQWLWNVIVSWRVAATYKVAKTDTEKWRSCSQINVVKVRVTHMNTTLTCPLLNVLC